MKRRKFCARIFAVLVAVLATGLPPVRSGLAQETLTGPQLLARLNELARKKGESLWLGVDLVIPRLLGLPAAPRCGVYMVRYSGDAKFHALLTYDEPATKQVRIIMSEGMMGVVEHYLTGLDGRLSGAIVTSTRVGPTYWRVAVKDAVLEFKATLRSWRLRQTALEAQPDANLSAPEDCERGQDRRPGSD
jgi:hypothetical protein